jgi:hypothetical protein
MIKQFNNFSDYLEFKCLDCNTVFNHAVRIFNGNPSHSKYAKDDPKRWDLLCIELRCPCCAMQKILKLSIDKH